MFATETLAGDAQRLTPEVSRRLAKLKQFAPGDFAAVKRQCDILAVEFSMEEFMEQLEAEHRIKPEVREHRSMGSCSSSSAQTRLCLPVASASIE